MRMLGKTQSSTGSIISLVIDGLCWWVAVAGRKGVIVVDIIGNGGPVYCNISPGCGND